MPTTVIMISGMRKRARPKRSLSAPKSPVNAADSTIITAIGTTKPSPNSSVMLKKLIRYEKNVCCAMPIRHAAARHIYSAGLARIFSGLKP